ncbi:YozD family protein [Priestia aryabhattai]|uniref:YozD family protein n=1 Tax=Priestia aryabhattai TaxID=412384 RepID=UPI0035AB9F14
MEYREVVIDTDKIKEFFHSELIKRGLVPGDEELDEVADITFEYLIHIGIIDEEEEEI